MQLSASKSHVLPHSGGCSLISHAFDQGFKSKEEIASAPGAGKAQGVFKDVVQSLEPAGI